MRRALRIISGLALAGCVGVLLGWGAALVISDRWVWSQYLSWIPTPAVLGAGTLLLAVSWWASSPGRRQRAKRPLRRARLFAACLLVAALAYMLLVEWRLANALRRPPPAGTPTLRILNWNITAVARAEQIVGPVGGQAPDVAVLVNPSSYVPWTEVYTTLAPTLPHRASESGIIVLSAFPVLRSASLWLGLPEATDEEGRAARGAHRDPGRAMYVELDTRERLGRTTVLWVLDMPSDERLSRWELARGASERIATWRGQERRRDARAGSSTLVGAGPGFPAPDVIVGDFNIPRGSASLRQLTRGMGNAFDQAGCGWSPSWPRIRPVFHIDQTFVGPGLRATGYRIIDPTFGFHRMQVADLAPGP